MYVVKSVLGLLILGSIAAIPLTPLGITISVARKTIKENTFRAILILLVGLLTSCTITWGFELVGIPMLKIIYAILKFIDHSLTSLLSGI